MATKRKYLSLIQQRIDRADYLTYISMFAHNQTTEYLKPGDKPFNVVYNGCNMPGKITDPDIHALKSVFVQHRAISFEKKFSCSSGAAGWQRL